MDLLHYFRLFRRWLWLIALVAVIFGALGYFIRQSQDPVYQAETTLLIGGAIQSVNPDPSQIQTSNQLVPVYAAIAKTHPVLEGTVSAARVEITEGELNDITNITIVEGTPLLTIHVRYHDPVIAAHLSNELAQQLILAGPSTLSAEEEQQISFLTNQIGSLSTQLEDTRRQLEQTDQQIETTSNQGDFDRLLEQRNTLVTQINDASFSIAEFSSTLAALQERSNVLEIVEYAQVPGAPSNPSVVVITILGIAIGAALGTGAVLLGDYLDETIGGTPQEVRESLQLPVLGAIAPFGRRKEPDKKLVTVQSPLSRISEQYRMLQTNVLAETKSSKATFLLTSPLEDDASSLTAANLGVALAASGLKVLLIDFNLRQPSLHRFFNLPNDSGVMTLLNADSNAVSEGTMQVIKPRIMVIEDDEDMRRLLAAQLGRANLDSVLVPDGRTALEEVAREKPDLILLDVMLPDMTGYQICERLRQDFPATRLPIMMLSALGGRVEDRIKGLQAGANDFMAKPYTTEELLSRIQMLLNFTRLQSNGTGRAHLPEVADQAVFETAVPNLWLVPSGNVKGDANLLDAMQVVHQFQEWAKMLQSHLEIDVMLFDAPASLVTADTSVLAAATASMVLLVLEGGRTKRTDALEAIEQFRHLGVDIGGVILNKATVS